MNRCNVSLLFSLLLTAVLCGSALAGVATVWNFDGSLDKAYGPGGMYYLDEDDAAHNPPGIPVGNSAYRTGSPAGGHVSTRSLTTFGATTLGGQPAGYMTFPKATDAWTGYYVDHSYGSTPAGGLSQYTMLFDIRVPQSSFTSGGYLSLLQTAADNSGAGDLFIDLTPAGAGKIGVSTIGYSATKPIQPDTWHRVAWVYDQGKTASPNTRAGSIYVDGVLVHQTDAAFAQDSRFRPYYKGVAGPTTMINPMEGFLLATSVNPSENSSAQLSSFLFVDRPMTQLEVQALGAPSANGLLDAVSQAPGVSAVQALSPAHYYRLNEATADTVTPNVVDSGGVPKTGAQHVGNFTSGGAQAGANGVWLPGFEQGNKGVFHNDAGAVKLGNTSSFSSSTMTVSLWFKAKAPTEPGGITDRIFQNNSSTDPLTIGLWGGKGLAIATGGDYSSDLMLPESTLNLHDGRWHHVVAVRNGASVSAAKLYVDGVDRTSQLVDSGSGWGNTGSDTWIGARDVPTNAGLYSGSSDEVALWLGRALSTTEVQSLYNAARTPANLPHYASTVLDTNPVAYYRLNEPAGITAGETVVNWANRGTTSVNVLGDANAGIDEASVAGMVPTFAITGPRPTNLIAGRGLNGLEADNTAAQFYADGANGATPDTTINLGTNPALLNSENLSYSLLFKSSSSQPFMRMVVTDPASPNDFYLIMDEGRMTLILDADAPVAWWAQGGVPRYNDDQWHHLVAVREGDLGANARLYIDGQAVTLTNRGGGAWGTPSSALIGGRGSANMYGYVGLLDEVAIWNRALTGLEARTLFNSLTVPEPASLAMFAFGGLLAVSLFRRRSR
jgi:hypothetical protein